MLGSQQPARSPAYQAGACALLVAVAAILGALAFEYIGGYKPCPLCLEQRYAYYAGIPVLFLALALLAGRRNNLALILFVVAGLAFLANAGLGGYHAGAEWKLWAGPDSCTGDVGLTTNAGGLLKNLSKVQVIRCDEPALRILGLSLAGWNVLVSLLIALFAFRAAARARQTD
jgi:disulfide bond formation protein DsbB